MENSLALLIFFFFYLRKVLQSKKTMPSTDKLFIAGIIATIALLILKSNFPVIRPFLAWPVHGLMFFLVYLCITKKEFQPAKMFMYALMPMAAINFVEDVAEIVSPSFYNEWETYFEIASIFSLVWLVTMLIINNRQRKALLKERAKLEEKEKEAKIAAEMKAVLEVQVAERTKELVGQKLELEKALGDLKAVQQQLIQNEKMASLGELTAGIAHEIQNPLNFVNNFSEVNKELLAEMNDAINNGDYEEAKSLAADISGNQDKINFHGKRADGIVKGMLQHSRSSTGQKEMTDINILCDEYLRLSYHGLRAKDKTFNARFETSFDGSVGKINVVPQDIGRVILNLINNAFYVVNEKKKTGIEGYEPMVTVSTKKENNKVLISVTDNGNGVPDSIKEKIFQPFFTTKPTGQGTGLGLSLSYDIVKTHGGELKLETKEGKGTTFMIIL